MKKYLFSFDGTESVVAECIQPDSIEAVKDNKFFTPYGAGLSYCGAALEHTGTIIQSTLYSKIIEFDPENNFVIVESGLSIGKLLEYLLEKGFWLDVIPGHPDITIGGCIGFNIHGKNQSKTGNFKTIVISFSLYHPEHSVLDCSRIQNEDVFHLTFGGFGLTGFILQIKLKIAPLLPAMKMVKRERKKIIHIKDALPFLLDINEPSHLYTWHDLNLKRSNFGRGYIFVESLCEGEMQNLGLKTDLNAKTRREKIPLPKAWETPTGLMNAFFRLKQDITPAIQKLSILQATFPILRNEAYYYQFGKKGFREYQCIIPFDEWDKFVDALEKEIGIAGIPITFTSLKIFSGQASFLNFLAEGICIAVNVANNQKSIHFFESLDRLVETHGGIVNISKDSRLGKQTVSKLFPEYGKFKDQINTFDPDRRVQSLLRRRLDV